MKVRIAHIHTLAINHSGTYCHKTGTRPPSCITPRQPTIARSAMTTLLTYLYEQQVAKVPKIPKKNYQKLWTPMNERSFA